MARIIEGMWRERIDEVLAGDRRGEEEGGRRRLVRISQQVSRRCNPSHSYACTKPRPMSSLPRNFPALGFQLASTRAHQVCTKFDTLHASLFLINRS